MRVGWPLLKVSEMVGDIAGRVRIETKKRQKER